MRNRPGVARWWRTHSGVGFGTAIAGAGILMLGACHDAATPAAPPDAIAKEPASAALASKAAPEAGVTLTPEQIEKLGVATHPAVPAQYSDETPGYGVVLPHDIIAQGAAELASAQATERQSRAALERARRLTGTPGAVSADVEESAAQKAAVDEAALTLTVEKLSATLGMNPPWKVGEAAPQLRDLASGRVKLVRATFPLGALSGGAPSNLRAARLGEPVSGSGWRLHTIWDAPADATMPGRSFFALLEGSDAGEGERLRVWAPSGRPEAGVRVPRAAAVLRDGKYWCYVEKTTGTFVRLEIDIDKSLGDGYFVSRGITAGDKIVIAAAGLLLAKETGTGAESD